MARNVEIKLRVGGHAAIVARLRALPGARDAGVLRQRDVFFHTPCGRLKLRTTTGRPAQLIHYDRPDNPTLRTSEYTIVETPDGDALGAVLDQVLGRRGEVRRRRHLFQFDNVRIHLDEVGHLGHFVELEAVLDAAHDEQACRQSAHDLVQALGLADAIPEARAYIDMLEIR